jgi:general secretion pathway protein D
MRPLRLAVAVIAPLLFAAGAIAAAAAPALPPPPTPTPPSPSPSDPKSEGPKPEGERLLRGERQFNSCLRLPKNRPIRVTLRPESEITDVIAWISGATCKGFIIATGLQLAGRKVTLFSPSDVTAAEAYRLFLALLETVQLTVEPAGDFLRVVDATKSTRALLPLYHPGDPTTREDGFVTRLVHLEHGEVAEVALVLQGYRTESGSVLAYPPGRTLILTDRAATVERLVTLIAALDTPGDEMRLWAIPAHNLSALDLAQLLAELAELPAGVVASGLRRGGTAVAAVATPAPAGAAAMAASHGGVSRILPDERSGRLLLVATEAGFARLSVLASKLDVPAETRAAKVHAYRCRHADCDAVASILGTLAGISVARGPSPDGARSRGQAVPAMPASTGTAGTALAGGAPAPMLFAGDVRVTSDPSMNALLVLASIDDFRALRRLVEEIDVPRKQVFIEATIMEVVRRKDRQVGVAYHGGAGSGTGSAFLGGFNAQNTLLLDQDSLSSALVGLSGLAVGAPLNGVASALGLSADSVPSLGAFIHLLQQDDNVDLIANPNLLITNNNEGEISVGQRVPVQGAFAGTTAGSAVAGLVPTVSVNREDVALTLKLTPHVNEDGMIRLELDQEMSELGATGPLGPSTSKRTTHTSVVARDQQTIIIGGLTRERQSDSAQKVPLLGDIPVLGFLFRSTEKTTEKQNIILAITPYVIDEPADLVRVLEAKLRDRRDFIRLYGSAEEKRLLEGPLPARTPGMLERINRAVKELDEASSAASASQRTPS